MKETPAAGSHEIWIRWLRGPVRIAHRLASCIGRTFAGLLARLVVVQTTSHPASKYASKTVRSGSASLMPAETAATALRLAGFVPQVLVWCECFEPWWGTFSASNEFIRFELVQ